MRGNRTSKWSKMNSTDRIKVEPTQMHIPEKCCQCQQTTTTRSAFHEERTTLMLPSHYQVLHISIHFHRH